MIHPLFRFLTTGSLLAVAFLMPLPLPVQGFDSSVARQPATARQRDSQPQPQVLTFPDLVTPQSLQPLDQLPKTTQMLELHFVEKPGSAHGPAAKDQIWMPARGDFKLRLKAGSSFAVLDPDGTDGEAVVQMPRHSLWEGFLQAAPSAYKQAVASLKLADPLYYVNQELAGKGGTGLSQWWRLGLRSFPVVADWHGPDGADSVLSFTNQNVSAFHLVWAKSTASKPDFPVGVAEIGPEGGVVELPGVGKVTFFSGALTQSTVICLRQEKQLVLDVAAFYNFSAISPAVSIYPNGLVLKGNYPANISLNIDKGKFIDGYAPTSFYYFGKTEASPYGWQALPHVIDRDANGYATLSTDDKFLLKNLTTVFSGAEKGSLKEFHTSSNTQPLTRWLSAAYSLADKRHPALDGFFNLYYTGTFAPVCAKISVEKSKNSS